MARGQVGLIWGAHVSTKSRLEDNVDNPTEALGETHIARPLFTHRRLSCTG